MNRATPGDHLLAAIELAEEAQRDQYGFLTEEGRRAVLAAYSMAVGTPYARKCLEAFSRNKSVEEGGDSRQQRRDARLLRSHRSYVSTLRRHQRLAGPEALNPKQGQDVDKDWDRYQNERLQQDAHWTERRNAQDREDEWRNLEENKAMEEDYQNQGEGPLGNEHDAGDGWGTLATTQELVDQGPGWYRGYSNVNPSYEPVYQTIRGRGKPNEQVQLFREVVTGVPPANQKAVFRKSLKPPQLKSMKRSGLLADKLRKVCCTFSDIEGLGPDYQNLWWNEDEKHAWWVSFDGDEEEGVREVVRRLKGVPGVEKVTAEAETSPRKKPGWVRIWARNTDQC